MKRISILLLVFCTCFVLSTWAQAPKIITFDYPNATGTFAFVINPEGAITGWYTDTNGVDHGFLRAPNGNFTSFDPANSAGTLAWGLNPEGVITGWYWTASEWWWNHGFLRAPDGTFTIFDAPDAGNQQGTGNYEGLEGTYGEAINPVGVIAGMYMDTNGVYHGLVRTPDGTITEFDAEGAGNGPLQGTWCSSSQGINPAGAISGNLQDTNGVYHAFVRDPFGHITKIDVRGAGTGSGQGTEASSINEFGAITGDYVDTNGVGHGFVRDPFGNITTFNVRGAATGSGQGTYGINNNLEGAVVGYFVDTNNADHGFVRDPFGNITTFNCLPAGTGSGQGTIPISNNAAGEVTGYCIDTSGVYHGFLLMP